MNDLKFLHTTDAITVVICGRAYSISAHQPGFDRVQRAVAEHRDPIEILGIIQESANKVQEIVRESLRRQSLSGRLTYDEGVLYYDGLPLFNYAATSMVKFLQLGHDASALGAFIEKQQEHPNKVMHDELYKFLEHGKIPLTPDGDFLTYKAVRPDYKDIHSGTFLNRVGDRPRLSGHSAVDPDRNRTCSYGLHVCSFGYLPHFANADGHVMICKVDPRDVVAIPSDYNNTKMRVVGYEVVAEVTSYYGRGEDILSKDRLADQRYEVRYEDAEGTKELYDHFFTLDEAKAQADDLPTRAWVVDKRTGETVYGN
jgi:hypothetical protein